MTQYYEILLPLAAILFFSKVFSKLCRRIGLPEVVGMLFAGLLIGCVKYLPGEPLISDTAVTGLGFIAKIGVILIMFSAGLCTDLKQLKAIGGPAIFITSFGVIVPMGLGFLVAVMFNGGFNVSRDVIISDLFYGVILTATSVSVTVATLKELGKLSGKVGATVVSAAIIDDVIGIVVLSFVVSLKGNGTETVSPLKVLLMTALFFLFVGVSGKLSSKYFNFLEKKFPHHRLLPILCLAFCFIMSYISERVFGVADITGAFAAGLFLSANPEAEYIDRKSEVIGYMIFTPVFFCNIGIANDFSGFSASMILFGLCFIAVGIIGKVIGCGGASLICGYSLKDSLCVGVGMMARAEVALVCAQKGVDNGIISASIMPFIVLLIIISSFVTPVCLKALFKEKKNKNSTAPAPGE